MLIKKNKLNLQNSLISTILGLASIIIILLCFQTVPFLSESYKAPNFSSFIKDNFYWFIFFIFLLMAFILPISLYFVFYKLKDDKIDVKQKLPGLWNVYENTFVRENENPKLIGKTRANADLYFNTESIASNFLWSIPVIDLFKLMSGTFVGLGVLGTFIGFSQFLGEFIDSGINLESTEVFVGLKVAFNTSIIGLLDSVLYNFLVFQPLLHLLNSAVTELTDNLDDEYYVTDEECMRSLSEIVGMTERSVEKNIKEMIAEVKAVITEERTQFTNQVLGTADLLRNINNSLDGIPEKVNTMCNQLNTSIDTAKRKNEEMLNLSIDKIQSKVCELFEKETESGIKAYQTLMTNIESDFTHEISAMQDSFESLVASSSANSKNVFELSINAISKISAELSDYVKSNNQILNQCIKDSVAEMELLTSKIENTGNVYVQLEQNLGLMVNQIGESQKVFVENTDNVKEIFIDLVTVSAMMKDSLQGFLTIAEMLKELPKQQVEMRILFSEASRTMEQSLNSLVGKVAEIMDSNIKDNDKVYINEN